MIKFEKANRNRGHRYLDFMAAKTYSYAFRMHIQGEVLEDRCKAIFCNSGMCIGNYQEEELEIIDNIGHLVAQLQLMSDLTGEDKDLMARLEKSAQMYAKAMDAADGSLKSMFYVANGSMFADSISEWPGGNFHKDLRDADKLLKEENHD